MKNICVIVALLVSLIFASPIIAQDEVQQESILGFVWDLAEGVPATLERTDSSSMVFTHSVFRVDDAGQAIEADSKGPFMRLSQTIRPLSELGSINDLQAMVITDAKVLANYLGTPDESMTILNCSRTIAGEIHEGKAVRAIIRPGPKKDDHLWGAYECYAFEYEDRGVGVLVKVATSDNDEIATDFGNAKAILENVQFNAVHPLDAYTKNIHGVDFRLPLSSKVSNSTKPAENSGVADVSMDGATARLIVLNVGNTAESDAVFSSFSKQFEDENRNSIENGGEGVKLITDRWLRFATGQNNPILINAPVYVYSNNGELMLNTVLSSRKELAQYASVTVSLADPDVAATILRTFGSGMQGGSDNNFQRVSTRFAPGMTLDLSSSVTLHPVIRGGLIEVLGTAQFNILQDRIDSIRSGKPFTAIGLIDTGESAEHLHKLYVDGLFSENAAREDKALQRNEGGPTHIEPNPSLGIARPWLRTELVDTGGNATAMDNICISTAIVDLPDSPKRLVVHSVSPTPLRGIEMGMTETIIASVTPLKDGERHSIGALELGGELAQQNWFANYDESNGRTTYSASLGDISVRAIVQNNDPRNSVLSARLLADRHMRSEHYWLSYDGERSAYSEESEGLAETTLAGHKALIFQQHVTGTDDGGTGLRRESVTMRLYGISHGEGYTTISIVQKDNFDDSRIEDIADMFLAPQK